MFNRSAELYDVLYDAAGKDYGTEAAGLRDLIVSRVPEGSELRDVACGSGRHLEHISQWFDCTGVDIEPTLLDIARRRCPQATFVHADMLDLDLGRSFDAVTCLFSSIAYVVTNDRLARAVQRMAAHLRPGGVLVIEPWVLPEVWTEDVVQVLTAQQQGWPLVRMMHSVRAGQVSVLDAHYLVGGPAGIEHFTERHELGLFSRSDYEGALTSAGLTAEWVAEGLCDRGLILGFRM